MSFPSALTRQVVGVVFFLDGIRELGAWLPGIPVIVELASVEHPVPRHCLLAVWARRCLGLIEVVALEMFAKAASMHEVAAGRALHERLV